MGVWVCGCGVWGVGCGVWGVGLAVITAICRPIENESMGGAILYRIRRLIVTSRKVSETRDRGLQFFNFSEAPKSERHKHFNNRSRAFETLRDLTI